jgi:hypothetical protein
MARRGLIILALSCAWMACRESPAGEDAARPPDDAPAPADRSVRAPAGAVQIQMRNVHLRLGRGVILKVDFLRGEMISATAGEPPIFDEPRSYTLRVFDGDISIDEASLTNLMNRYVFAYDDAPIQDVAVSLKDGRLEQKGKLDKGIGIPFSAKATVVATADGRLRLRVDAMRAAGIPATTLMKWFGLSLDSIIDLKRRGLELDGNDITIGFGDVLPPPRLVGRLAHVRIDDRQLRQTFAADDGRARPPLRPGAHARNYVLFAGAVLRFGKLTMTGADLQLIDADERDPFDFYPAGYARQLVAGYSKSTADGGLHTYMPDWSDLRATTDLRPSR